MGIGGVSGAYQAYQIYRTQPMNYAVQNQADVSDAYKESVGVDRARTMDPVPPVLYANAQKVPVAKSPEPDEAGKVNRQFNAIASRYQGDTVGYTRGAQGITGYGVAGSMFDAAV
ncbi:MAG: hypothetical protein IJT34_03040 [Butyrivibrio sp.]|nr:hypothetical protein [Butyrivibrio sp.]